MKPKQKKDPLREFQLSLIRDMQLLGFSDPYQSISGARAVDYLAALYNDLKGMVKK